MELACPQQHRPDPPLSASLYQFLFNAVNDAIVLVDPRTGAFVEVNDKFCQMTGFSRQEAQGLGIDALFTGEGSFSAAQAAGYIQKALQEGPQLFEWLAQDRTGRRHWVELNLSAVQIGPQPYLVATVRDIQARKEAEQALKQREGAIAALLEALQDVALLLDPDGIILAANTTAARRLHRSATELIGVNVFDLLPPALGQARKAKAAEVLQTGRIVQFEDEYGGVKIFNILYPIFDADGRVAQVGVYAMDVTEERRTRAELEKIRARLEYLLDHSPAALYSSHFTNCCGMLYVSENIAALTGFSRAEVLASPDFWAQHLHPEDRFRVCEARLAGLEAGQHSLEYRFLHQDGTYRWLHDQCNLVRDKQGAPLEYIGSLLDITSAKEAQEQLWLSEARYRAIVECQTDLINRFKPDTTLIYVNDAICRLFGKSREELIGQSFLPFLTPEDQQDFLSFMASFTPEQAVLEREHRVLLPDGGHRWQAWKNYAFFDDQGRLQELQGVGRDITRRREAEEALRESELRFRTYVESSLVGVVVLQDGFMPYVNPALARMLGYTPVELMAGMAALDLIHPDDREYVKNKIAERLAGAPPEQYTVRILHRQGGVVHCELRGSRIEYQGRPAILGTLIDVTPRIEAEAARQESERNFRFLVENMNDGLGISDNQQRITYVNPRVCELWGYDAAELLGRPLKDFLDPESQQIFERHFQQRRRGDQTSYELVWIRKDGSRLPTIISPKPIFDQSGGFKGSFAIITDITALREAEAAVQRREQYFRQLTENVSDIIGLLTADGTISYFNPTVSQLLGYDPKHLIGKSVFDLIHPDDLETQHQLFFRLLQQSRRVFSTEVQVRHRNGSWHVLKVKGKNLLDDPVVAGIVINAQDITEQKSMEAVLRTSARYLRALTAEIFTAQETERRRLSLELHDELGQSLTALKLQLRSIANKLRKDQPRLKQECGQMLTYLNDVVENVRRLSHDLSPSLLENVGLGAALRHLMSSYQQFYQIEDNLQELEGIEAWLTSKAQIHLYRIFQEIFTNIEKHSQANQVRVNIARTKMRLTFTVADNGKGFPSDRALDLSYQNPGLGLSAINERILILGGSLEIASQEETGTTIRFSVPLHKHLNQQERMLPCGSITW